MEDQEDHILEDLKDHTMEDQEDHTMEDHTMEDHIMDTKGEKLSLKILVNLFQKHLFLDQLTYNMTNDCSLIYQFSR